MFTGQAAGSQPQSRRKVWMVAIVLVIILGVGGVILAMSHHTKKPTKTSSSTTSTSSSTSIDGSRVLLDMSSSGIKKTQAFTTTGNWEVAYTFDCTNFGYKGNFQIDVFNTDGSDNIDDGANDLAMKGGSTDHFSDPGEHYLSIHSECNWHITVKE